MSGTTHTLPDLHGHYELPFGDADHQPVTYLERVTVQTRGRARHLIAWACGCDYIDVNPRKIHMRWVTEADPDGLIDGVSVELPTWLVCGKDEPGALPFWKVEF